MILYYIRHGDPIYSPDSLTPLGCRQAEAVAKRLALHGLDKVYCSTSNRAILTAKPTCEMLKLEPELLDFTNENYAWAELTLTEPDGTGRRWLFQDQQIIERIHTPEFRALGDRWYDYPEFQKYDFQKGIDRIYTETDAFLEQLGYEHIRYTGKYKVKKSNDQRIALFAHQGFGLAFLSCILDIPYPTFCTHFDINHSGVTVVEFAENGEHCVPKILMHSSDAHLYREGLPTRYINGIYL